MIKMESIKTYRTDIVLTPKELSISTFEITSVHIMGFVSISQDKIVPSESPDSDDVWIEAWSGMITNREKSKLHFIVNKDMDIVFGVSWDDEQSRDADTPHGNVIIELTNIANIKTFKKLLTEELSKLGDTNVSEKTEDSSETTLP